MGFARHSNESPNDRVWRPLEGDEKDDEVASPFSWDRDHGETFDGNHPSDARPLPPRSRGD